MDTQAPRVTSPFTRGVLITAGGTAMGLAAAAVLAVSRDNLEFLFYIAIVVLLCLGVLIMHWRVRLTTPLLACLSAWALLHMAGGLIPVPASWPINGDVRVLYSWWIIPVGDGGLKYDHVIHAYGFGVSTWLCWQGLGSLVRASGGRVRPTSGPLLLSVLAACGLGAFNEIVEFVATRITDTNVGGYVNTGWDLVANLTGATAAACLIRLLTPR
ncbi:MAG: hypothetical protein KDA21_08945 [Phycisphaerales bacterium]|nr:hypothetical protein [Phycisphaerales bacterium]